MEKITLISLIFASTMVFVSCDDEADIQATDTNTTQGNSSNPISNLNKCPRSNFSSLSLDSIKYLF